MQNLPCPVASNIYVTTFPRKAFSNFASIRVDNANISRPRRSDRHALPSALPTAAAAVATIINIRRRLRAKTPKFRSLPVTTRLRGETSRRENPSRIPRKS